MRPGGELETTVRAGRKPSCFHVSSCVQNGTWKQKALQPKGLPVASTFPGEVLLNFIELLMTQSKYPHIRIWSVAVAALRRYCQATGKKQSRVVSLAVLQYVHKKEGKAPEEKKG
jgi:hypothetical protein